MNTNQTVSKNRVVITIATIIVIAVIAFAIYYIDMLGVGFSSM
jgi:hypothetical protein